MNTDEEIVILVPPSATDNCSGEIIATTTDPLQYNEVGTYEVTWNYADASSNLASQTQTVIIQGILPVKLSRFSAKCNTVNIEFEWTTETESNSAYFEVEGSKDGISWVSFGKVQVSGSSNERINYNHKANSVEQFYLYRLKQVDNDGATYYSELIAIHCATQSASVNVYPNPTARKLIVSILDEYQSVSKLELINELGQVLMTKKIELNGVQQSLEFDLSAYPSGIYQINTIGTSR